MNEEPTYGADYDAVTGAAEAHETNGTDHQGRTATAHPICAAAGEQPLHLIEPQGCHVDAEATDASHEGLEVPMHMSVCTCQHCGWSLNKTFQLPSRLQSSSDASSWHDTLTDLVALVKPGPQCETTCGQEAKSADQVRRRTVGPLGDCCR